MWIFKNAPNLIITVPENTANSGDHNGGIPVSVCALGDKNQHLPCFCLPTLTQNPLGVSSRIIHRWNREDRLSIHREITETS